jgi:signal transduction histidine kinase
MQILYKRIFLIFIIVFFSTNAETIASNENEEVSIEEQIDEMARQCWVLREPYSDSALQLGKQALELAEQNNFPYRQAKISNFIGVVYLHYLENYQKSIPYFQQAMRLSVLLKDSVQMAYAYNNLGDVFLLNGNLPLSLKYGELTYEIFDKIDHDDGRAYALINLAEVHRAKKNYQKSIDLFNQATEIRQKYSNSRLGFVAFNKARTLEESGHIEEAKKIYKESLELSYQSNDFRYVSWSLNGLANVFYKEGEFNKAFEYYDKALEWNRGKGHEYGFIENLIGLALVHAHKKEKEEGLEKLNEAIKISNKLGVNTKIIKSYNALLEFHRIIGDYENLKKSFDIFIVRYDSILSAQQFEIVNEMERSFTIQQELYTKDQQIEFDKKERTVMGIIMALLIIIILIGIRQYRLNKKMNRQLEEMNQTKDRLFSVISHDLKNPFNTLIGFSDILQSDLEDGHLKDAQKHAALIHKASYEGYKQLNNLLNWSLSQSGKIEFRPELIDLGKIFNDIEELFAVESDKYNIHFNIENGVNQKIKLDPNILMIVLENLISNAFKYTPEEGEIKVSSTIENQLLIIKVQDSGIGMPLEMIETILGKDQNIQSSKGLRKEKGTGLGLSIVSELVKIHKGEMNISSHPEKGSLFKIQFPIH